MTKKATKKATKTAGWEIPDHVKEEFTDFCKRVGTLAKDDCAGALFIWQFLPAHLRERAKLDAKDHPLADEAQAFWVQWDLALDLIIERGLLNALLRISEAAGPEAAANAVVDGALGDAAKRRRSQGRTARSRKADGKSRDK